MPFDLPFLDLRRRRQAEQGLIDDADMATPRFNPDASTPFGLPPAPASRTLPRLANDQPGPTPTTMPGKSYPSSLPEGPSTRPSVALARREAGGATPMPESLSNVMRPPSRYEQMQEAKDVYMLGTPGRLKSGALGVLRGAVRGAAQGGQGGGGLGGVIGGAVGGALGGGAYGAADPRGARQIEFNEKVAPKIQERFAYDDADRRMRMEAEKALRDDQAARANILNTQDQIRSRREGDVLAAEKDAREGRKPITARPGDVGYKPGTYEKVFEVPRQESQSERDAKIAADLDDEEGTVEAVSQGSLRGRLDSLKQRLTPDEQRMVFGGATEDDLPEDVKRATAKWNKIQSDELNSIRRDTGERRKAAISRRRAGGQSRPAMRKGQPGRTAISLQEAADLLK